MMMMMMMMAEKKEAGSSRNGRDSNSKRLGIKRNHKQFVRAGCIILTQRGAAKKCGRGVYYGRTYNIHALTDGFVSFRKTNNGVYVDIL